MLIHASSVLIDGHAVLIAGASGCGKSDLTLRLIDEGARLIADDQTKVTRTDHQLVASAPETIKGILEVRHVGLLRVPFVESAAVTLYVQLVALTHELERLPEPDFIVLEDMNVRRLHLPAFAASTPAKIRAVLKYADAKL